VEGVPALNYISLFDGHDIFPFISCLIQTFESTAVIIIDILVDVCNEFDFLQKNFVVISIVEYDITVIIL